MNCRKKTPCQRERDYHEAQLHRRTKENQDVNEKQKEGIKQDAGAKKLSTTRYKSVFSPVKKSLIYPPKIHPNIPHPSLYK